MSHVLHDMYTGPDGAGYSIGRVYSLPVLLLGLGYPIVRLAQGHAWEPLELGAYLASLGGACWIFIRGHNEIDTPGGPVPQRRLPATQVALPNPPVTVE